MLYQNKNYMYLILEHQQVQKCVVLPLLVKSARRNYDSLSNIHLILHESSYLRVVTLWYIYSTIIV